MLLNNEEYNTDLRPRYTNSRIGLAPINKRLEIIRLERELAGQG